MEQELLPDSEIPAAIGDERRGKPSASSLDAEVRCYGRRDFIRRSILPERKETKWSKRGDRIHKGLELSDLSALSPSDIATAERIMFEEARLVEKYHFEGARVHRELRIWYKDVFSGKLDAVHEITWSGLVIDAKTGFSLIVPIAHNYQIRAQAILARHEFGLKYVTAGLIHPHHPDLLSQSIVYDERELDFIEQDLLGHLEQMTADAPRTPNPISCAYCPARALCPEFKQWTDKIIPVEPVRAVQAVVNAMTPEERAQRLKLFAIAQDVIKEEREAMKKGLESDPAYIPGWKLVPGTDRVITDAKRALDIVSAQFGHEVADACLDFRITSLEEQLVEKKHVSKKKDAKLKANALLGEVLTFKRKEPSLKEGQ